jgi:hypothetical protein
MSLARSSIFGALRGWMAATAVALLLAGCGGGGGDSTPAPGGGGGTAILDSFGQPVGSDAGIGDGDSGADGTAGEGKPIVGGTVMITDATGKTANATTNAEGYYRVKVTGFTAPFVVKVTAPGGKVFHSLNVKQTQANKFITINVSGLTDKIASDVAKAGGASGAAQLTPAIVAANTNAITTSINNLRTQLAPVITNAGIDVNTFDPIGVPFKADHTGYDKVLDNVVVTVNPDGSTGVAISPTFNGGGSTGYTGNWSASMTVTAEGQSQTIDGGVVPGSAVPTEAQLSALGAEALRQQFVEQYEGYTISGSGNTITISGQGTELTIVINSYSISGYQGCGACGVGSTVTYNAQMVITVSGTSGGYPFPATQSSSNTTFRYTRVN